MQVETIRTIGTTGLRMVANRWKAMSVPQGPSTCRNDVIMEEVKTLILANCCLTVRENGDKLGISKDSSQAILMQDLGMCRVSAKFVPRLLSEEQKRVHLDNTQD